ncbi:hypothetical protein C8R46DRAFT_1080231 [Mycena filopes]|nr:hypothetical protein C8R46DRAFT_1080231 [Mycena filopes]
MAASERETSSWSSQLAVNAREQLLASSNEIEGYLMGIDVANLVWCSKGTFGNQVVSKEALEDAKRAYDEHLEDPTKPQAGPVEPFVFSMIVSIASDGFFATSCARWNGPSAIAPTFADVKLRFTGVAPADGVLAADFQHSSEILQQLFTLAKTSNTSGHRGVLPAANGPYQSERGWRFTHQLFEKVKNGEEDDSTVPATFKIDQWPVASEAAREAIEQMKATHRVNYLEAFDASGKLVIPTAYEEKLRGSLAIIRFTLSHYYIRGENVNSFTANIDHIRILNPPTPASPSKKRRKFTDVDNITGNISPKKLRLAES